MKVYENSGKLLEFSTPFGETCCLTQAMAKSLLPTLATFAATGSTVRTAEALVLPFTVEINGTRKHRTLEDGTFSEVYQEPNTRRRISLGTKLYSPLGLDGAFAPIRWGNPYHVLGAVHDQLVVRRYSSRRGWQYSCVSLFEIQIGLYRPKPTRRKD